MKEFNLNSKVRVRLTDYGRERLRIDTIRYCKYTPCKEDSEGWSVWQMWSLMEKLGGYVHMGGQLPFEPTIEIIE